LSRTFFKVFNFLSKAFMAAALADSLFRIPLTRVFVKNFFLEVAQKKGRTKRTHQIAGFEKMM